MSKRLQNPSLGGPRPCKVWMSVAGSQSKHWANGVGYSQIPIHQFKVRILPRFCKFAACLQAPTRGKACSREWWPDVVHKNLSDAKNFRLPIR